MREYYLMHSGARAQIHPGRKITRDELVSKTSGAKRPKKNPAFMNGIFSSSSYEEIQNQIFTLTGTTNPQLALQAFREYIAAEKATGNYTAKQMAQMDAAMRIATAAMTGRKGGVNSTTSNHSSGHF